MIWSDIWNQWQDFISDFVSPNAFKLGIGEIIPENLVQCFSFSQSLSLERDDASLFWLVVGLSLEKWLLKGNQRLFQIQKGPAQSREHLVQGQNKKCPKVRHWDKKDQQNLNSAGLPEEETGEV